MSIISIIFWYWHNPLLWANAFPLGFIITQNHYGWKRSQRPSSPSLIQHCHVPKCHTSVFLNAFRNDNSTACLGSLFQCLTTLSEKNFVLISNLNWCDLRLFSLPLLLITCEKRPTPTFPVPIFQGVVESSKVPPSFLFSRLNNPSSLCCSSQDLCFRPFPSFVDPTSIIISTTENIKQDT